MKVALIAGVTALIVCSWLIVDFVFFLRRRKKKAQERNDDMPNSSTIRISKERGHGEPKKETRMHRYKLKPKAKKKSVRVAINRFRKHN